MAIGNFLWEDAPSEDKYSVCVHCGMCLESCPTYQELGLEHQSPRGRVYLIKSVAEGQMELNSLSMDPIFTCLDCRACETACPSGVKVGSLVEEARGQVFKAIPDPFVKRNVKKFFLRGVFANQKYMHSLGKMTRFYQKSGLQKLARKTGMLRILPDHLREMEAILPEIPKQPSVESIPEVTSPEGEKRARVALLTGCVMDVIFSEINEATVRVLAKNGCEIVVPREQNCCGALQIHAGDRETAKMLARKNIDTFLSLDADKVVVNAAGCGAFMKEYEELFCHDPEYREKAKQFSAKVEDVSKFLYDLGFRKPKGKVEAKITYHDACHLAHAQNIRFEPRQLLKEIPGIQLIEMPDADRCCGSAGIYNITHPEMAGRLLKRKMEDIPEEVELVSMGNPGCMMQMALGVHRHHRNEKIVHTVQILDWAYAKESETEERGE
ncbi:(Fe-S)-binding protein [Microaerobacter geothermalis]|uniref:(Fe-S)-binding protein n=1 Tax=Microaerobacter geothermalis TaxID=674972 RepID=UPI001F33A824|nr:(Fe-S)-binding protein [Microaerobacter geothermalis]MCF6092846.1 (Fe-S)-binding protein [Microaerobacter geothermalis]